MAGFGSVLRGFGSVLNPQVAQEVAQEDRLNDQQSQQVGMLMLQKRLQEQSPEYQAKMEALKNEKMFREEVSAAGGDMTKVAGAAVKYGKPELAANIYNQQEARAARIQQAADALEARKQELQMRLDDKALDREARTRTEQLMLGLKQQSLALQRELALGNQELKKLQFTMKADERLKGEVQKLGGALEKANLPEADAVLGAVEDALKKSPNLSEYLAGPKSVVPDMGLGLVPGLKNADEIREGRQAFQKLFNITLKNRSGAAVTIPEFERLKKEFATGVWKTSEQIAKGVSQAREIIQKHYASVTAGFGKDALDAYNENIRGIGGRVVLEARPKADGVIDFGSLK